MLVCAATVAAEIDPVWSEAPRAAVERAFAATGLPYAASSFARTARLLDAQVTRFGATRLAARLTGPHQLVVVKGSDHLLTLDDQRDEVFRAVLEFLER